MSHTSSKPTVITIRAAEPGDVSKLATLAGRDSSQLPAEPLLVAEVGSQIRAAISMADGSVVADPFHRTAEVVEMLRIRATVAAGTAPAQVRRVSRSRRVRVAFRTAG